jgi:hypothetical protein
MYLYIAVLRKFLREYVMLCVAWRCLLYVVSLDQLVLVCYVFMLLLWYCDTCLCLQWALTVYVYPVVWGSVELMFFCIIDYIILSFLVSLHFVLSLFPIFVC